MNTRLKILLIEDDADDIELLEEALKVNNVPYFLDVLMEGDKVAAYITQLQDLPAVVVLDFNLPRVHGREVLKILRSSENFNTIPIIVLTTSTAKEDMRYALEMGAAHFITKPTSMDGFKHTVSTIVHTAVKKN